MVCHVYNKSIAGFTIFNNARDFERIIAALEYYRFQYNGLSLSKYIRDSQKPEFPAVAKAEMIVNIVAYCIMPTHIHLILEELRADAITTYMNNALNSYSHYFNINHRRKGPLWEGRSNKVLIEDDNRLLHLTRYVHLNPVTANLVDSPEDWPYSSYSEYICKAKAGEKMCNYDDLIDINPFVYADFVKDRICYQRELARIKHQLQD